MSEKTKAAEFLFSKIKKLYPTFDVPDELDIEVWLDVLDGYSQTQILDALKAYRRNTEYNSAPTPANFEKWLKLQEKDAPVHEETPKVKYFNPAVEFMQRDINLGKCKHTIKAYDRAVDYIINELLLDEIPVQEHAKMDFSTKCANAKNKGLFKDFDDILEQLATTGEVQPKAVDSFNSAGAILAGHWGAE